MKQKGKSSFQRLMGYAGKRKYLTYLSLALAVVSAVIALIPFYEIWRIIKEVLEVRPDFSQAVHIKTYGWYAVGGALLSMLFYIAALMCSHLAAFRVQANMRIAMMEHIMKLPLGYVESEGTGKIRKIVSDSSAATETYLAHNLPDKAVSIATPIALLAVMAVFDWRLGLMCLIPAAIAFVLMGSAMMGPKLAADMKEYQNALESMSSEAVEYVRGIPVVKTFGQTIFSFRRFKKAIDEYEKWTVSYTKSMMMPMVGFTTAVNAVFAVLILSAYLFTGHGVTDTFILNLLFYILISSILTVTLMKIAYAGESNMIVTDALNRMDSILDLSPLAEAEKPKSPANASVSMENVVFAYDGSERNAIDGITLEIPAGQHIALVGPSGGGKTTLASLAARFWDVKSGSIRIGGTDVKEIDGKELMNQVSYVFQDSKLLKMSILENVRMGRPDASDAEVMQALRDAQCMDIIEKFPDGVNTQIGAKGVYVSGGEAQRLAIARALYKDAPFVILDEPTAALDPIAEAQIYENFNEMVKNKTAIYISHRMSSCKFCDRIVVLDTGSIAEMGTHDTLLAENGIYARLYQTQAQYYA